MSNKLQLRRDTAANWEAASPVILAQGEIGLILDNKGKVVGQKIGDGVTEWKELSISLAESVIDRSIPTITEQLILSGKQYIDKNGDVVSYPSYGISQQIKLFKNDILSYSNISAVGVSHLSEVLDGEYIPLLTYDISNTNRGKVNVYIADRDMIVVISSGMTTEATYTIKRYSEAFVSEAFVIDAIDDSSCYFVNKTQTVEIGISGSYITKTGKIEPYAGYNISMPISLSKGETVSSEFYSGGASAIAQVIDSGENSEYVPLVLAEGVKKIYSYTAKEDCNVVMCGDYTLKKASYTLNKKTYIKDAIQRIPEPFVLLNPYAAANFEGQVCAQTHEHCIDKEKIEKSYNRGIRVFACSHYTPSVPRFPFSNFKNAYQDYKSKQAVLDGDLELVTRYVEGSIPTLETDEGSVETDNIVQIANAERAFAKGANGQHLNILGLLWGSAGNALCNGELTKSEEDSQIKYDYSLESFEQFNEFLSDESKWQFGSKFAFGTVNHSTSPDNIMKVVDSCPAIFKAVELFNQGYGDKWNLDFRNAYDHILKTGRRLWGAAVVDWQDDWATWGWITSEEQTEWQTKYESLSDEDKTKYGSAQEFYMQTGRVLHDRGTNVLLLDASYEKMSVAEKAKAAIKAYIDGCYYMSGTNTKSMKLTTDNRLVTFKLSDFADRVYVITANGRQEYLNVDSVNYVANANDMFVRFEAFWDNGDDRGEFIFTNPVWVERA